MKLDEIFKNGIDPTIKVSNPSYGTGSYFIFFFKTVDNYYYGLNSNQQAFGYNGNTTGWQLWIETKKKVKKWLWAYYVNNNWVCHNRYYDSLDDLIKEDLLDSNLKIKRLDWSETEFEE